MQLLNSGPSWVMILLICELLLVVALLGRRHSRNKARDSVLPRAYLATRSGSREPLSFHERLGM